jgi:hypothetical protein
MRAGPIDLLKEKSMTRSDIILLFKKIVVGVIITMVPFCILLGGLTLTQKILSAEKPAQSDVKKEKIKKTDE